MANFFFLKFPNPYLKPTSSLSFLRLFIANRWKGVWLLTGGTWAGRVHAGCLRVAAGGLVRHIVGWEQAGWWPVLGQCDQELVGVLLWRVGLAELVIKPVHGYAWP